MSRSSGKRERALRWVMLSGLLLLLIGCVKHTRPSGASAPTATLPPTPDNMAIYIMLTDKYTAFHVIMSIDEMTANEAARILQALQAIEPPVSLEALHEQAVDAYEQICIGKLLLPGSDSVERAEAYFMIDWGISRLLDYREQLDSLQKSGTE